MTAPPFTPGDWIADEECLVVETADHKLDIAMVFDDGTCPAEQLKADVHLLGASKALYAALLALVDVGEFASASEKLDAKKQARAAIKQAEGHR